MHVYKYAEMGASAIPFLMHIPRQIQCIGKQSAMICFQRRRGMLDGFWLWACIGFGFEFRA